MNCSGIFDSALRTICETELNGNVADYAERAEYLLATFCRQCAKIDRDYRSAFGLPPQGNLPIVKIPQENEFPLCEPFLPAAVYYLAAMLVIDENETLSDSLFSLYTDCIATLQCSIPAKKEAIKNKYPQ